MRTALAICSVIVLGFALGYGVGFSMSGVASMKALPLATYAGRDNFIGILQGFNRLTTAEVAGGACDIPRQDYLTAEDGAISDIQNRAGALGLNPPLDLARARLALRRARLAEKKNDLQLKMKYEEDVKQLLVKSAWKDPSPAHLRQIVYAIDSRYNTCNAAKEDQSR